MSNGNYPSPNTAYQGVHALIGYGVIVTSALFHLDILEAYIVLAIGAFIKEFVWDMYGPEHDSFYNSSVDFFWYMAGGVVGIGVVWGL